MRTTKRLGVAKPASSLPDGSASGPVHKHEVISVLAQKGGTGKTTLSVAIACAAAADGLSTVIVDLDPQGSGQSASRRTAVDRRLPTDQFLVAALGVRVAQPVHAVQPRLARLLLVEPALDSVVASRRYEGTAAREPARIVENAPLACVENGYFSPLAALPPRRLEHDDVAPVRERRRELDGLLAPQSERRLQIARRVDDLSRAWLGIVSGVTLPSSFILRMAMWLPSRTISNPSSPRARTTLRRGASFGNRVTA